VTARREPWVRLGQVIPEVLAFWKDRADSPLQLIRANWDTIMGMPAAAHTTPLSLRGKLLVMAADSSVWASEVSGFQRRAIIESLNKVLGEAIVTDLQVVSRRLSREANSSGELHDKRSDKI
jgi:predicted nucleic acid-binding Zn ribbon protein